MQSVIDLNTVIVIISFLLVLIAISYFINKKRDLLRFHLKSNYSLNITANSLIGNGNRITIFEVEDNNFLVVTNRSNISNIITLPNKESKNRKSSGVNND